MAVSRVLLWGLLISFLGLLAFSVYGSFLLPLDDAFIVTRYAHHLLNEGVLAWNPGGDPSYGLTSLLFLIVVAPVYALSHDPVLSGLVSSVFSGAIFLALLFWLIWVETRQTVCLVWAAFLLAVAVPSLTVHFNSGMDTTFAMAGLTLWLILFLRFQHNPSSRMAAYLTGIWGGLMFMIRPDALVFVIAGLITIGLTDKEARRLAVESLCAVAAVLGLSVIGAWWYFDSLLPLPFSAKSLGLYGEAFEEVYRLRPYKEFSKFCYDLRYALGIFALEVILYRRAWLSWARPGEKGLIFGLLAFIGYHLFFVTPIMGSEARFFYPCLPVVIWLSVRSLSRCLDRLPPSLRLSLWWRLLATAMILYAAVPALESVLERQRLWQKLNLRSVVSPVHQFEMFAGFWPGLDELSALPNDLVIATTEVGLPGALNPEKVIVDMAGLNETAIAHRGFSADWLFENYLPDWIYLPHPHYVEMISEIEGHPFFQNSYDYLPGKKMGTEMGVALLKASPYFGEMNRIRKEAIERLRPG